MAKMKKANNTEQKITNNGIYYGTIALTVLIVIKQFLL